MTFDEWWQSAKSAGQVPMWDSNKASARLAWEAATAAEREACAKVCDEKSKGLMNLSESPLMTDAGKELHYTMHVASMNCATAIRARNATPAQD